MSILLALLMTRIGHATKQSMFFMRQSRVRKLASLDEAAGEILPPRVKEHDGWHVGRYGGYVGNSKPQA